MKPFNDNETRSQIYDPARASARVDIPEIPEDPRIFEVVQEYLTELEQGRTPRQADYLSRYPELSIAVKQCLDGLDMVRAETPTPAHSSLSASRGVKGAAVPLSGVDGPSRPLGDFQIVREVARGGMGIVYEAIQLSLGRKVALKVLPFAATLDNRQLQRFKNEAQAAALLHHQHIVPVFAVGCERGVHFYAMQLIEGQSLAVLIKQLRKQAGLPGSEAIPSGELHSSNVLSPQMLAEPSAVQPGRSRSGVVPMPAPETALQFHAAFSTQHAGRDARFFRTAARLMLESALALEHAHQFGIVHRDIKPGNLLLDVDGKVWVTDFGLAQFRANPDLTSTGEIPGTLRYMSPEQASGQRSVLDQRSDIYSLGATFYELLTLKPIFDAANLQSLLNQILHDEPRGLRDVDKAIPVELETIILKSVAKNPDDRYRTASEVAADLQRYLDHKPILARRPSLADRIRKWSRRHPSAVIAGMLLLVVISVFLTISRQREAARANEAEQLFQQARQAVDLLIEVSEDELANNPAARQRLLGLALGYYQDFIEQREGNVAAQAELAVVHKRVEKILHEMQMLEREMHLQVLGNGEVQDELKLNSELKTELTGRLKEWSAERMALMHQLHELGEDSVRMKMVELAEGHDREVSRLLTNDQRKRLDQIVLQSAHVFAFKHPTVMRLLQLTLEQRRGIRLIERELFGRAFGTPGRGRESGSPPQEIPSKEQAVKKVLSLLSESQRAKWKELIGDPAPDFNLWKLPGPQPPGPQPPGPQPPGPPPGDRPPGDLPPGERPPGDRRNPPRRPEPSVEVPQARATDFASLTTLSIG